MPRLTVIAIVALATATAAAEPLPDEPLASAASSERSRAELDEQAQGRTVDLLRQLPGLYAIAVDGGGQAEAYLTRGFDAHSGLDLEVLVDGVPVNIAGPGADHGYADTQFVIPEAVDHVALHLGPYAARYGNFASAGALELHTLDEVPGGGAAVQLSTGAALTQPLIARLRDLQYRVTAMASPALETSHALLAVEIGVGGGPFVHPLDLQRGSILGKWSYPFANGVVQLAATMFSGRATDSGVVPEAEVDAGRVARFGAVDPTLGDTAARTSVSAGVTVRDTAGGSWHLGGYAVAASHRIYTDPTAFLRDVERGDQREQVDARTLIGLDGWYLRAHALGGMDGQLRLGVQARADDGTAELWHDAERVRLDTCVTTPNPCLQATSKVRDLALYAEDALHLGRVTLRSGLRVDQVTWDSADAAPATPAPATGNAARALVSPKLGVTVAAAPGVELSALAGGGFRTSDTRAVIATDALRATPRIWSTELGARLHFDDQLSAGLAAYAAWQDAEVRWIADLQVPEAVPRSRRTGVDGRVSYTPRPWLTVDANLSVAHAVANPGAGEAPVLLAPRIFGGAGITARDATSFVSLRGLGLGARQATDQLSTPAQAVLTLAAGTRWHGFTLGLDIDNLLDAVWREQQSALTVRGSRTAAPITGLVYTPGAPLTATLTLGYRS